MLQNEERGWDEKVELIFKVVYFNKIQLYYHMLRMSE